MATDAQERFDNEGLKFGGTKPDKIFVKTNLVDSSGDAVTSNS